MWIGDRPERARLTEGPIWQHLLRLSVPMIWGIVAIIGFHLVDTFFVARLGTVALAAMSFTFPVVTVLGNLALGLGAGASSLIARAIGEGNHRKVRRLTTDALTLACLVVGMGVAVGLTTMDPLFRLMGADAHTLPLIREYMTVWYLGMGFLVVPMVGNAAIRATGDTFYPSVVMVVAALANGILDPLLIFGWGPVPAMGLRGAAWATVMGRALTLVTSLAILHFRERLLMPPWHSWKGLLRSWKSILEMGVPAAGANMVIPVTMAVITSLVSVFGPKAVAAFGLSTRLEQFSMVILIAVSAAMGPLSGQNWGAGSFRRVRSALSLGFVFSALVGIATTVLFAVWSEPIVALFDSDQDVVSMASAYLHIVPASFAFAGFILISGSAFVSLGKPWRTTVITLTRMVVLFIPMAWLGRALWGVEGIFYAASLSNVVVGLMGFWWIHRLCRPLART